VPRVKTRALMTRRLCRSKCLGIHHAKEASSGNCRVKWTVMKHLMPKAVSIASLILPLPVSAGYYFHRC